MENVLLNFWTSFNIIATIIGTLYITGAIAAFVLSLLVIIRHKTYLKQFGSANWTVKDIELLLTTTIHSWSGVISVSKVL